MVKKADRKFLYLIIFIVLSATAARLVAGLLYYNTFDTFWYRNWAFSLQEGLFDIYTRAEAISLDYPPLYLFCLYLTGAAYKFFGADCTSQLQMFLMKFWPILADALCIMVIWRLCRRHGEWTAVFAALSWAANPSVFFNTAYWGQTDQLMALLLLLAFSEAEKEKPILSCVLFAIAGLTKYQSLFFTPVLLIFLLRKCGIKRLALGIGAAASTVAAVFLPFMIGAKDPFLFFKVYLGGAGTYKYCTFNAYNIYALLGLNTALDNNFALVNVLVIAALILATVIFYFFGRRTNVWVGGLFIMEAIFMLITRMHERYQFVVLPFALMAYVTTKNRHFIINFCLLTVTSFVNQAAVLLRVNAHSSFFTIYQNEAMMSLSIINLLVFIYVLYSTVQYFFKKEETV